MEILKSWGLILLAVLIAGCQGAITSDNAPGLRIISLAPSITEILFALELEEHIVGITTACDYPAGTKGIEKIATFSAQANLERILTLEPDIVFSTGLEQQPLVQKLETLGIEVALVFPGNLNELLEDILKIGALTEREKQAQGLVKQMKEKINKIEEGVRAMSDQQKPKVFVELCSDPLITAGSGSFIDNLIKTAGGENIAEDTKRPYSQFSPEVVLERNPDYIILGYMSRQGSKSVLERAGWQTIKAVQKRQIIADIDPDLFLRPGPRAVDGLEELHRRFFH